MNCAFYDLLVQTTYLDDRIERKTKNKKRSTMCNARSHTRDIVLETFAHIAEAVNQSCRAVVALFFEW